MNSNCDTFIKQEFLTAEEQLLNSIPDADLNILVKNEPITDEPFSAVTIKTEPLLEGTRLTETVSIKTEHIQEAISGPRDSFVIYELQPQKHTVGQETIRELSRPTLQTHTENTIQATKQAPENTQTSFTINLNQTNLINTRSIVGGLATTKSAVPPPVLLNDKLRKRHKVIIPAKSADKRKRYNIAGTPSTLLEKRNKTIAATIQSSKICRLLNSGNKKIINHLMQHKHKQKEPEENCDLSTSAANIRNDNTNHSTGQRVGSNYSEQTTATQTQPATILPLPATIDILNAAKQLTDSPTVPELRVKCLCSLTDDSTGDNSELREFFKEMFVQTRCLSKTQQRLVKMSLLTAICNAEDAVEQGKCCSF